MLLLISTEPKAFPHVAPRPPIHSTYTVTRGPSLKETLLVAFFVTSALSIAHSVISGKQRWALEREDRLRQYAPADSQFGLFNSTTSGRIGEFDDYERELMDSERDDSTYYTNMRRPDDHSSDEDQERTVVLNTTYKVRQSDLKPKHETLTISETPSLATHNCIDGVCGPRKAKIQKDVNFEELPGNPNGAGEHIMPSIKPDAEKLPSEIAGEYIKKVKDYVKQLKTASPQQSYQLRRKYAQSRRQQWDDFNRARKEAKESTLVQTERM